ncbi:MAG: bile acid:sodium symporter family protein [Chloroflexota bacterium]
METFLAQLSQIVTPAFAVTTMLAMGMRLTVREIVGPLRNPRFIAAALALNFVVVPAAAWLIVHALRLQPDVAAGLVLISAGAGAPMIPKLVTIAKGDAASAVALVTLLVVATVVIMPVLLAFLLEGVTVDSAAIAGSLGWQMVLPLAVGVLVRERYPEEADDYVDEVAAISNVTLALLLVSSVGQNLGGAVGLLGNGGIVATVLLVAAGIVAGYVLGVPAGVERRLLALGTAQRNVAAAFIVAVGSFADRPTVLALVATSGIVMMLMLFPLAGEWSKRPSRLREEAHFDADEEAWRERA